MPSKLVFTFENLFTKTNETIYVNITNAIKIIKYQSHLSTDQIIKMIETGGFNELSKDTLFIVNNDISTALKSIKIIFSNTFITDAINRINDYADEKEAVTLLCYLFDVIDKKYFATHPSC